MSQFEVELMLSEDPIIIATVEVNASTELSEEYFRLKSIQQIRNIVLNDGLYKADVLSITEIGEIVND
jgi:hypothetical protein